MTIPSVALLKFCNIEVVSHTNYVEHDKAILATPTCPKQICSKFLQIQYKIILYNYLEIQTVFK